MQAELKQVIYVSEKTDFSENSLTNIFDTSEKKQSRKGYNWLLVDWK